VQQFFFSYLTLFKTESSFLTESIQLLESLTKLFNCTCYVVSKHLWTTNCIGTRSRGLFYRDSKLGPQEYETVCYQFRGVTE